MRLAPSRLLLLLALAALPLSAMAFLSPLGAGLAAAGYGLLTLAALFDAWRALEAPGAWKAEVPGVVRLSRGREATLTVLVRTPDTFAGRLVAGLEAPPHLGINEVLPAAAPSPEGRAAFAWELQPQARGRFEGLVLHLQHPSRGRLWDVRHALPLACELRVYPNLRTHRRAFASLFQRRGLTGFHTVRQVGKGREFEKLREYQPGDTYDDISWKATAKRGFPVTREMQVERTQELYLIIDASRLSGRPVGPPSGPGGGDTLLEGFVTIAGLVALAAEAQGDLFGVATFSRELDRLVPARGGRGQRKLVQETLFTVESERVTPDFESIFASLRTRLRRRALLLFLTDLRDPVGAESFLAHAPLLGRHHLCLVNTVRPPEAAPLFRRHAVPANEEDAYRMLAGHLTWSRLRDLERSLQEGGFGFAMPSHDELAVAVVRQYLNVKRRQSL